MKKKKFRYAVENFTLILLTYIKKNYIQRGRKIFILKKNFFISSGFMGDVDEKNFILTKK